ncbi:MAG: VanZ family protein [Myxococcota bacterium]
MEDVESRRWRWLPPILWALGLFWFVTRPVVMPLPWQFPGMDKIAHALLYAPFGALMRRSIDDRVGPAGPGGQALAIVAIVAVTHGGIVEWRQSHVPGRSAEAWDVAADLAGALAGAWLLSVSRWARASGASR